MTQGFKITLLWLGASLGALVLALAPVSASFFNGEYLPIGPDGFYHARRILDAVANPSDFFQFDPMTHVPDGNLITWPWAYDYFMSLIVRGVLALGLASDPMAVLVHIPPLAFPLAILLMLGICRSLQLNTAATALALLATAFFPLSQSLYALGNIDHHFAEHLFVLGTLAVSLRWLRDPGSRARAIVAGMVFGLATGVHTAMFVLQLPLLFTLFILWTRRQPLPTHGAWFAATLLAAQLLIALPSLPLQRGAFDYYTLSWFQVYIAACTGVVVVLLGRLPRDARGIAVLAALALVLLFPTVRQVLYARDFFTNAIAGMDGISEVRSMFELWRSMRSFAYVASLYTWLLVLLPLTALWCAWRLLRAREPVELHFWIVSVAGLVLLVFQVRLQYFGSFALYLPWLVALSEWSRSRPRFAPAAAAAGALVLAIAYFPGLRTAVFAPQILSGDANYAATRTLYQPLAEACERQPGVVLANPLDGHYIRYHSKCKVIANNFLVTPDDVRKTADELRLLQLPARELPTAAPSIEYVFVRSVTIFFVDTSGRLEFAPGEYAERPNYPLVRELLSADVATLPPSYRLIRELRASPEAPAYARLFAIERGARQRT